MSTPKKNSFVQTSVEQTVNNTTGWIGHRPWDNNTISRGQTFVTPVEGDLDSIEIFSSMVTRPGKVQMTLYSFDALHHSWGNALGSTSIEVNNTDSGKWVCFNIPGQHLEQGETYGFRLDCTDTLMGIGEAAGSHHQPPYKNGEEWKFTASDKTGHAFSYFSLAFKVGLRA